MWTLQKIANEKSMRSIFRPFDAEYTTGETLGTGGYAVVKEATHIETGEKYAIKIMKARPLSYIHNIQITCHIFRLYMIGI